MIDDHTTTCELEQLEAHIQTRLGGQVRDLRLALGDRGLVLRGYTHTYYAKQLAQHAVMKAARFALMANEIEVV
jgi:hypothetical protein